MKVAESFWGIRCVWLRYFDVFAKSIHYYMITTFIEPILYLLSFGLGVGSLVGKFELHGISMEYRSFIFSGIIGQTLLFQGFFEASYGGFIRMYYQKIFSAMATTPITLSEVLWGELLWDSTKACFAAWVVALIGVITGDFKAICLIQILPICILSSLLFSGLGLTVAALSRNIEQISYPQYLLVFPMFLFCGVLYPIETLPHPFQEFAWILPLTAVNSLIHTLTLGFPLKQGAIPLTVFWTVFFLWFSRRSMTRRLIK